MTDLRFIEANPVIRGYREQQEFDLKQRTGEAGLEGQQLSNQFNRGAMGGRLRTINAGATSAETEAGVGQQTAPHRVSQQESAARTAGAGADVAEGTVGSRIAASDAAARSAGAGADVAQGTVNSRIAQAHSDARSADAGARTAASNANVNERTEGTRVKAAEAGLRQAEAGATNTELSSFYKVVELLNAGDINGAKALAGRTGQQFPEGMFESADVRAALATAAKRAQEQYPGRPRDQQVYIRSYLTAMGERVKAGQPANEPTAPYNVPGAPEPQEVGGGAHNYEIVNRQEIGPDGKPVIRSYSFDRRTSTLTPLQGEGAIQKPTGAGGRGAGSTSVFQQKHDAWLAAHPGDVQGALDYANNKRSMNESDIAKAAISMARAEANANATLKYNAKALNDFLRTRPAEIAAQIRSGFAVPPAAGGQPGATPAPAPAPAAPAQAAPQQQPTVIGPTSAMPPPPGNGTREAPFQATTQDHIEWFKANAKPGQVIMIEGKPYTK